ncbi:hypothetical protein GQ43DRAFT_382902 [Delitschia confertaspora ATCC 74209]|uniref:Uncharacterized protein n=1 Tax=Delitschia confertaspora ATCC 74209 TaxID=1513339 RepID=A0A9P4MR35_9PLEO|nr:hypothetical protein GQ43DRAFT_382902 [Delitschia confertaspora ATCC 74209]
MKSTLLLLLLAAISTASPFAHPAAPTAIPTTNGTNSTEPTKTRWHHNPHKEPTPSFKQNCDCAKPIVPIDLLTPAEKCEFEYAAAMGCYYRAQGGCPSPTLAVSLAHSLL